MKIDVNNNYKIHDILSKVGSKKIVLYGAGSAVSSYARICHSALSYYNIKQDCFVDDDKQKWGSTFLENKIYSPTYLSKNSSDFIVIISSNYFSTIIKKLEEINFKGEVYSMTSLMRETPAIAYEELMNYGEVQRRLHTHNFKLERIKASNNSERDLIFNAFDIEVTERCSMKCIDCSNLMQYYEKPIDSDTNIIISSLEKIFTAVDRIDDARVLGGEPFMYKDLPIVLNFLANEPKAERITVYSNGTFVPRDNIIEALKHPKIEVEITDYDKLSKKHSEMMTAFENNGVNYITHKPQNWTDSARIVKNKKTVSELSEMFEKCCVNDAITLLHGKLYHCPFSANAYNLKGIPKDESDFIDITLISDTKQLRELISKFYYGKPYLSACGYCLGRDYSQKVVVPAVQTKYFIPILAEK